MNILTEIHRCEGIDLSGRTMERTAVRGVILRGPSVLMILSTAVGDFKFPGGGVKAGEPHDQALRREIREECGARIVEIKDQIGVIVEYKSPQETDFEVFKMDSHYYGCEVEDRFGMQQLDEYEQALGFHPVWVDIGKAIQVNKSLLNSKTAPDWLRREIFALEYIRQNLTPAT